MPGGSVTPGGKPLFVISNDLTEMKIDTKVSEADIGKLVPDQKAYFKVDAYPGDVAGVLCLRRPLLGAHRCTDALLL